MAHRVRPRQVLLAVVSSCVAGAAAVQLGDVRQQVGPAGDLAVQAAGAEAAQPQHSGQAKGAQSPLLFEYQKLQQYSTVSYSQNVQLHQLLEVFQERNTKMRDAIQNITSAKNGIEQAVMKVFKEHQTLVNENKKYEDDAKQLKNTSEETEAQRQKRIHEYNVANREYEAQQKNITQLKAHIEKLQKYNEKVVGDNKIMQENLKKMTQDKKRTEANIHRIDVDLQQWNEWMKRLTDWNKQLQSEVQKALPEDVKTNLQANLDHLSTENKQLLNVHKSMAEGTQNLDGQSAELKVQIEKLKYGNAKMTADKVQLEAKTKILSHQNSERKVHLERQNRLNEQQKVLIDEVRRLIEVDAKKAVELKEKLVQELAEVSKMKAGTEGRLNQFVEQQHKLMNLQIGLDTEATKLKKDKEQLQQYYDVVVTKNRQLQNYSTQLQSQKHQQEFAKDELASKNALLKGRKGRLTGGQNQMAGMTKQLEDEKKNLELEILEDKKALAVLEAKHEGKAASAVASNKTVEGETLKLAALKGKLEKATEEHARVLKTYGNSAKAKQLAEENTKMRDKLWDNFRRQQKLLDNTKQLEEQKKVLRARGRELDGSLARLRDAMKTPNPSYAVLKEMHQDYNTLRDAYDKLRKSNSELEKQKSKPRPKSTSTSAGAR